MELQTRQFKEQIISENKNIKFKQITTKYQANEILIDNLETILIDNLYELSDYIFSCNHFISLNSGSHSVAASVRNYNKKFKQIWLDNQWIIFI